jgi:crotonobetainyl-CoA:carnitine CoA-transferase CaiB-like acyl-CoA transferase
LCNILQIPEFIDDFRFSSTGSRKENEDEINNIVAQCMLKFNDEELCKEFDKANLVYGHLNDVGQVVNSEQFKARDMKCNVRYLGSGEVIPVTASALKISNMEHETEYVTYPIGYHTIEEISKYVDIETAHEIYDPILAETKKASEARLIRAKII